MTANHTLILRLNFLELIVLDKRSISGDKRLKIWILFFDSPQAEGFFFFIDRGG